MATKKKTTEVAVKEESNSALPAYMKQNAGQGMDGIGVNDLEIPRLKLLQGINPEVVNDGMAVGEFYHTVLEDTLGDSLRITPILVRKEFVLWEPGRSGTILARAKDGKHWSPSEGEFEVNIGKKNAKKMVKWKLKPTVHESGLADWGSSDPSDKGSEPAATEMFTVLVTFPDNPELGIAALTLQRGFIKVGRKFLSKMKLSQAPIFGQVYNMSVVNDQNKNGDLYKNYKFTADGFTSEADYQRFEQLHKQFSTTDFDVKDLEGVAAESAEADEDLEQGARKF